MIVALYLCIMTKMNITEKDLNLVKGIIYAKAYYFAVEIAPLYEFLDWEWGYPNPKVPGVEEIFEALIRMIKDLSKKVSTVSTGGLQVKYFWNEDEYMTKISFIKSDEMGTYDYFEKKKE